MNSQVQPPQVRRAPVPPGALQAVRRPLPARPLQLPVALRKDVGLSASGKQHLLDDLSNRESLFNFQAVLSDFEDACAHVEDKEARREIMLVADSLR